MKRLPKSIRAENTEAQTKRAAPKGGQASAAPPQPAPDTGRELSRLLMKIGVIAAVVIVLLTVFFGIFVNYGNNMYPAVRDGDLCITYRRGGYAVGQVVAYRQDGVRRFGRVVATEGHVVDITEEGLLVDGSVQYELVVYPTTAEGATVSLPYEVGPGEVFLLNDYREDFTDSRTMGAWPVKELDGHVVAMYRRRGI